MKPKPIKETWWIAVINGTPRWPYLELSKKDVQERLETDRSKPDSVLCFLTEGQSNPDVRIAKLRVTEIQSTKSTLSTKSKP